MAGLSHLMRGTMVPPAAFEDSLQTNPVCALIEAPDKRISKVES